MNTSPPLVSIITPTLDARDVIASCVTSVLSQDYPHVEHVIVDGGSTDGTVLQLRQYAREHPGRLRYITEPDHGPADAWNKGLKMSRGAILGCIGADDLCEPGGIRAVVEFFQAHPGAAFVHGGCRQVSDDGIVVDHRPEPFDYDVFVNTARHIATPSAYYTRDALDRVGWFDECGNDFELMLRIARLFPIHHIDVTLSTLRRNVGTAFNPLDPAKRAAAFRDDYRVSRRYGGGLLSPIALRYYWAAIAARLGIDPTSRISRALSAAARAVRAVQ